MQIAQQCQNQHRTLVLNEYLAKKIGLNEAIVLSQMLYWQKKYAFKEWIHNSYEDWQKQLGFFSLSTIKRTIASLKDQGFITIKRARAYNFYQVHVDAVTKLLGQESNIERPIPNIEEPLKQMLELWEKKLPSSGQQLSLTRERKDKLHALFVTVLNSDLKKWEELVDAITKSNFLMGKVRDFKASIDWAVTPEIATRILEGAYTQKAQANKIDPIKTQADSDALIEQIIDRDWQATSRLLVKDISAETYCSWFGKIKFKQYKDNCIYLEAESKFIADWVDGHFHHKIIQAWHGATCEEAKTTKITAKPLTLGEV